MRWYVHRAESTLLGHFVWACPAYHIPFTPLLESLANRANIWAAELAPIMVDIQSPVHYVVEVVPLRSTRPSGNIRYYPTREELPRLLNTLTKVMVEEIMSGRAVPCKMPDWGPLQVVTKPPAWPAVETTRMMRMANPPRNVIMEGLREFQWLERSLNRLAEQGEGFTAIDVIMEAHQTLAQKLANFLGVAYYLPPNVFCSPVHGGGFTLLGESAILSHNGQALSVCLPKGPAYTKLVAPLPWCPREDNSMQKYTAAYARRQLSVVCDALLELGVAVPHHYEGQLARAQEHPALELRRRRGFADGTVLYERRLLGSVVDYVAVRGSAISRGLTPRAAVSRTAT